MKSTLGGGGEALYIGMCGPKGYGVSAVLVINRVWVLHSSLELGMRFRRSYFFIIIDKTIIKSLNRVSNFWSGNK